MRVAKPILLICLAASKLEAQSPADGTLSGAFLTPYVREAQQITTDANGRVINARPHWRDEVTEISIDGKRYLQRVWQMKAFNGALYAVDTVIFDPATLETRFTTEWVQGTVAWRRQYDGLVVTGQKLTASAGGSGMGVKLGDPKAKLDVRLARRAYDLFGGLDGILAASIDLTPGKTTRLDVYDPVGDSVRTLDLTVTGQEMVEAGRGKVVNAFVVSFEDANGPVRLWVNKQAPFVYKSESTLLRDGKPWRIFTSVMVI